MEDWGSTAIELINSSNLEKYRSRALAVIPMQKDELSPAIGKALGAASLSIPALEGLAHSGEQLAYIKMPAGFSPADCYARADGFGGNTLSAGGFANGSWTAAAINPGMVAMAGVAFAAIVVIEKQMAEINERLGVIESDVKSIVELLGIQRRSEVEGIYDRLLNDYVARFDEYVSDPEKLRAARGEIERSLTDVSKLWAEQKNTMRALGEHMDASRHSKKEFLEESIQKFNNYEQGAATVFELSCALDQVRMFYDRDVSPQRVVRERNHAKKRCDEYEDVHNQTLKGLTAKIKEYEGAPLALASEDKLDKRNALPANVLEGIAQNAGGIVERLRKQTLWDAADERTDKEIDAMLSSIPSTASAALCESVLVKADASLSRLGTVLGTSKAMLYDGSNAYLLEEDVVVRN